MPLGAALSSCFNIVFSPCLQGVSVWKYVKDLIFYTAKIQKNIDIHKLFMLKHRQMY